MVGFNYVSILHSLALIMVSLSAKTGGLDESTGSKLSRGGGQKVSDRRIEVGIRHDTAKTRRTERRGGAMWFLVCQGRERRLTGK